jgi:hypothetical protein
MFLRILSSNVCNVHRHGAAVLMIQVINILYFRHTQQIYITITHLCATISWRHISVAPLRTSSGQYYTMCAFHARTLWDPIVRTDDCYNNIF